MAPMNGAPIEFTCVYCGGTDIEAEIEGTAYFHPGKQRMEVSDDFDIKQWYCLQCEWHFEEPYEVDYP